MDLYRLITEDHREIRKTVKLLVDGDRSARMREKDFLSLWREVMSHQIAEEKVFYSPLLESDEAELIANEAIEKHGLVRTVLRELDKATPAGADWAAKVKVLGELLEGHFKDEEGETFKMARTVLADEDVEAMAKEFAAMKKRIAPMQEPDTARAAAPRR
jgi:hemerythrin-like domain-containing protein